ncbi:MAG: helix-turn-helix domain-containing protein [Pirellulales bacterium]|nr:helix-turn-helix domain-containing protein [Pirellulales bacterium]
MAGHKPWSTLIDKMSPERRAAYEKAAKEQRIGRLVAQMRKHSGLTQQELAERLGISQPRLSSVEGADDLRVDTLKNIVSELGGEVVIHMPDGDIVLS